MQSRYTKLTAVILVFIAAVLVFLIFFPKQNRSKEEYTAPLPTGRVWEVRSIDTMKDSRDKAREKLHDESYGIEIDRQMNLIAKIGANYAAVNTPYDAEFLPYLRRWVKSARKHNLNVWFRGNFSSWEGWFSYKKDITRQDHMELTRNFIAKNPDLFEDNDIFTACAECENGGPGDPRYQTDIGGFRTFMIDERKIMKDEFRRIGKNVKTNYTSMNLDLAKQVYDQQTLEAMDRVIVVDHYSKEPENLIAEVLEAAKLPGTKIVMGEFGAPIDAFTGSMNEAQQASWIESVMKLASQNESIAGMNWWVAADFESAILDESGFRDGATVLQKYFSLRDLSNL